MRGSEGAWAVVRGVVRAVLSAADPASAMARAVRAGGGRGEGLPRGLVVSVGKAARAMARGFVEGGGEACGPMCLVTPEDADHPVPTERNVRAAERVVAAIEAWRRGERDGEVLCVLLSGGASALVTMPMDGLTVEDVAAATRALLRAGAPIEDLNCVRRHVDGLKGGRMAAMAWPRRVEQWVLSDVLGDRLEVIGSGPCAADSTTFADALGVLERYGVGGACGRVREFLEAGARGGHAETIKPGDRVLGHVRTAIVGSNAMAVDAAAEELTRHGFRVVGVERGVAGEAAEAGRRLGVLARALGPGEAIVWGGETTVRVGEACGVGGRNQEIALAAAVEIEGAGGVAVAAFGTDGVDGPTDAAGAGVTGETCARARESGLDASAALAAHDSHTLFATLERAGWEHLIRTGPTGTNVNDVAIALRVRG